MDHTSQNNGMNDIVSALGISGVGFGGKDAWGAPWFAVQGIRGSAIHLPPRRCTRGTRCLNWRDMFAWQHGGHAMKFGGDFTVTFGQCGAFFRIAVTTNSQTDTPRNSASMTAAALGLRAFF